MNLEQRLLQEIETLHLVESGEITIEEYNGEFTPYSLRMLFEQLYDRLTKGEQAHGKDAA